MDHNGLQIPEEFGDVVSELDACENTCGLYDHSYRGILRITGDTAQDFLHRMSSNPVNDLKVGQGMETVIPTAEGRFVDWITLYRMDEKELLAVTSAGAADKIVEFLHGYIFFKDDVQFEEVSSQWAILEVIGPGSESAVTTAFPGDLVFRDLYKMTETELSGVPVFLTRINGISDVQLQILSPVSVAEEVYDRLLKSDQHIIPVGYRAYELKRIMSGYPKFGREITDEFMLTEAHLDTALNLESGCFTGQEVIARTLNYDKVKQHLCHFEFSKRCDFSVPVDIKKDGRVAGKLTSAAYHPVMEKTVSLGYVKTKYVEEDTSFDLDTKTDYSATLKKVTEYI